MRRTPENRSRARSGVCRSRAPVAREGGEPRSPRPDRPGKRGTRPSGGAAGITRAARPRRHPARSRMAALAFGVGNHLPEPIDEPAEEPFGSVRFLVLGLVGDLA